MVRLWSDGFYPERDSFPKWSDDGHMNFQGKRSDGFPSKEIRYIGGPILVREISRVERLSLRGSQIMVRRFTQKLDMLPSGQMLFR